MMDTGRLTKKERHELILSEVRRSASIRISKLAKRIGVAGETIRRDLIELGDAGLINRTYGGATISLVTSEPVISERGLTLVEERARIGKGAARLIENRQVVMIDGGSTTYEVARNLAQLKRDLVVITNSVGIATVAGGNPTFRVILCPGTYDNREGSVLGEDTVEFISRYNADAAIIGASGITADGPSDAISGAAAVKRAMIGRSLSVILVATHDKFGRASLERVCRLMQISDIVTDRKVSSEFRAAVAAAGTELHIFEERE
jgi:DeoR/GlpR family transcriptional regulator of sugar metabolism